MNTYTPTAKPTQPIRDENWTKIYAGSWNAAFARDPSAMLKRIFSNIQDRTEIYHYRGHDAGDFAVRAYWQFNERLDESVIIGYIYDPTIQEIVAQ